MSSRCAGRRAAARASGRLTIAWLHLDIKHVQSYLSDTASFVLCVVCRVKDHHNLLHYSPLLKKTWVRLSSVRQVVPPDLTSLSATRLRALASCIPRRLRSAARASSRRDVHFSYGGLATNSPTISSCFEIEGTKDAVADRTAGPGGLTGDDGWNPL